ncbi:MAG: M15 family metallopeptidase [Clostridia bacterium]|nr:M15 family metallopeptidase [Clostridia bacterium]
MYKSRIFAFLLAVFTVFSMMGCGTNQSAFVLNTDMPTEAAGTPSAALETESQEQTPDIESTPIVEHTAVPSEPPEEQPAQEQKATAPTETPAPKKSDTPAPAAPTEEPSSAPEPTFTPAPTAAPTEETIAAPTEAPTPTPKPTATPTPAPTATPTSAPTAVPTAQPNSNSLSLTQSANLPLPSANEDLPQGQPFCFGGVVRCDSPILSVTAIVKTQSGANAISGSVSFSEAQNVKRVELVDPTFPKENDASLTKKLKFEDLAAGNYAFSLYAEAVGSGSTLLYSSAFKVVGGEWRQLISNNLRNCYAYALQFFGSRDQFMFRYRWASGRQIEVESSWLYPRMTSVTSPSGQTWYVHKKAQPHYNLAINYMKTSFVRVRGNYDSGVIRLWDLVASFDGILNTRFVSARDFVSHHAFGTAIDLNASMTPNNNVLVNRALILSEVRDELTYNGIKTENGVSYYDFTYTGNYSEKHRNVPTTVVNYLLYELAFYRAGFSWGYYYAHACDAMHFGLSEMSADTHNTSDRSLRKVYSYIG